jgi:hypothetical protein
MWIRSDPKLLKPVGYGSAIISYYGCDLLTLWGSNKLKFMYRLGLVLVTVAGWRNICSWSTHCCGSGIFIPDHGSQILIFIHSGSRIQQRQQKKWGGGGLSSQKYGFGTYSGSHIQGSKGTGSQTKNLEPQHKKLDLQHWKARKHNALYIVLT